MLKIFIGYCFEISTIICKFITENNAFYKKNKINMNETPKAKKWAILYFLLFISLIVLPKAGVDFVQSTIRIQVEKTRQENLQALTLSVRGNDLQTAELTREIKLSQFMLSNQKEIKKLTIFLLSFHLLILIGLIRSLAKRRENSAALQKV